MSDHSLKELKRQRDNAYSVKNKADIDFAAAEKRLHDAMARETGLINKVATTRRNKFLVQSIHFMGEKPFWIKGFKLKNDGTAGFQEVGDAFKNCEFSDYTSS